MTNTFQSMAEIERDHPNEWVLIDRPQSRPGSLAVVGGYVVMTSPDRDEFDRRLADHPEVVRGAVHYTGKPEPNAIWLLNI